MAERYYIDTCIWRDHYENRFGPGGRPLGQIASKLFIKLIREKKIIIFSDFILRELKIDYPENEINDMFNLLFISGKTEKVKINKKDIDEANKLKIERNISFGDCLHAILARNSNGVLVTQNEKDFKQILDIVKFKKPEEIIKG
jgi:predicted nucleic acid-binding protein